MRIEPRPFQTYGRKDLRSIPQLDRLGSDELLALEAVSWVLPFRVNNHVLDALIRWDDVPDDPIYQLTFPQPGMLAPRDLLRMKDLIARGASDDILRQAAREIQRSMNPHPAGQLALNVPRDAGGTYEGIQHKYRETVLFFPRQGQTCHAYCTYCFRWAQFVGDDELLFASRDAQGLVRYLGAHPEVTDVLVTGGDPMVMKTSVLRRYIEPLLDPRLSHVTSIRIGTKAPAYWPYRFLTDPDADELMRLFEEVQAAGRQLAIMAHFSHPRELAPLVAREAVRRIRSTGAVVRCQAPLIRHVNDDPEVWSRMWRRQVALGAVPYYMFVERDTGPRNYFEVPLARALSIYSEAYRGVSGLARTVRGPSMSATPGKVLVDGVTEVAGEHVFVLKFVQARDPSWVQEVFFARFDPRATWLDDLRPAFGEREFFFEPSLQRLAARRRAAPA